MPELDRLNGQKATSSWTSSVSMFAICWSPIWLGLVALAFGFIGPKEEDGLNYKAMCADGSTSLSEGSGTCAYHGGVQYSVPDEAQSSRMHAMDRVTNEIEADLRKDGYLE